MHCVFRASKLPIPPGLTGPGKFTVPKSYGLRAPTTMSTTPTATAAPPAQGGIV
jgi:hypothetical protein